jgi:hypothetical protein
VLFITILKVSIKSDIKTKFCKTQKAQTIALFNYFQTLLSEGLKIIIFKNCE